MPRSSRHKSHKQHKHSSKDGKEFSDSEDDVSLKDRKGREEVTARVSRDSASGEKRKLVSQSQDGKGQSAPGNGDMSEEYAASKRRKDRDDSVVADRWNGGEDERGEGLMADKVVKGEVSRPDSEKGPKSKVSVDSKSKSSRRHDSLGERKDENASLAVESEDAKKSISKSDPKRKSEKDSGRKDIHQNKDVKDKERSTERDRKVQDARRERSVDATAGTGNEVSRKQGSQSRALDDDHPAKRGSENTEWQIQDELRNPELEKELEKRIRRRDASGDKDKYQDDVRDGSDRRLSLREDHSKDDKYKDGRYRDKYREDGSRDNRHREDKHREERSLRDRGNDRPDGKHLRHESKSAESRHKKSKPQDCDRDESPHHDDQSTRYTDNKGKKRSSDDNADHSDVRSRSSKEHRSDMEKKSLRSSRVDSIADRGRSQSGNADMDSTLSNNRRKDSPSSSSHAAKEQYRHSKHENSKYRDTVSEERGRLHTTSKREASGVSVGLERASKSHSLEKSIQKDYNHLGEQSTERSSRSDTHASPGRLMEKSPSSTSVDHRYSNKINVRRSLDVEESGRRSSGSKDARDYSANEDRLNRKLPMEKHPLDELSQADGDTISVSSSFNRTGYLPSNNSSALPPPLPPRVGKDGPLVTGSLDEDSRGRFTNRHRRSVDPNVGRGQGNAWKGIHNWPSPVTNGFIPFQRGPPPGDFHPVMPQFPSAPLFGVRPSMELNHAGVPYHIPDAERFSSHGRTFVWRNQAEDSCPRHLRGWDGSNTVFGDESHIYGKPDWDQNKPMVSGSGWEAGADLWKGQNGGLNMVFPSAAQKEDYSICTPADDIWTVQSGQWSRNERSRPGLRAERAESIEIKRSSGTPPEKETEDLAKTIHEKAPEKSKISTDDSPRFCHFYLSKLDISAELTRPELYNECVSLLGMESKSTVDEGPENMFSEGGANVETAKGIDTGTKITDGTLNALLFPAIKDSVFQGAMALYKKQVKEMRTGASAAIAQGSEPVKVISDGKKLELNLTSDQGRAEEPIQDKAKNAICTDDRETPKEPVSTSDQGKAGELIPANDLGKMEAVPTPDKEKAEELVNCSLEKVEVSIPIVSHEEPEESVVYSDEQKQEPVLTSVSKKVEIVIEDVVEDRFSSHECVAGAASILPSNDEDVKGTSDPKDNPSANGAEVQQVFGDDTMCGSLSMERPSEQCEAMIPGSCESELVNLSRIHHSPESTR